jgi:hypothetical protein
LVRQPLFGDKSRLFLFTEREELVGIAEPVPEYPFGDVAGAGKQQHQAKALREQFSSLKAETDTLRPLDSMREAVALEPEPQAETTGVISINPQFRDLARLPQKAPAEKADATRRHRDELSEILRQVAASG